MRSNRQRTGVIVVIAFLLPWLTAESCDEQKPAQTPAPTAVPTAGGDNLTTSLTGLTSVPSPKGPPPPNASGATIYQPTMTSTLPSHSSDPSTDSGTTTTPSSP